MTARRRHRLKHLDRATVRLLVVGLIMALLGIGAVVERALTTDTAVASPTTTIPAPTTTTDPTPRPQVPLATTLATATAGEAPTYNAPGGTQIGTVGTWYGYAMTMPVLEDQGDWLRIRLPVRPNGATAWVRRAQMTLSSTPYRIVVRRGHTDVTVFKDGFPVFTIPAGIGKASTPTPLGSFFVAVIEKPGPAGYGPIVLDTSGHSEAIQSWEGAGDAIIALHGPISSSSDAQIGSTGTHISNGCVRLHESDQLKLAVIPLGTPVDIVD